MTKGRPLYLRKVGQATQGAGRGLGQGARGDTPEGTFPEGRYGVGTDGVQTPGPLTPHSVVRGELFYLLWPQSPDPSKGKDDVLHARKPRAFSL